MDGRTRFVILDMKAFSDFAKEMVNSSLYSWMMIDNVR